MGDHGPASARLTNPAVRVRIMSLGASCPVPAHLFAGNVCDLLGGLVCVAVAAAIGLPGFNIFPASAGFVNLDLDQLVFTHCFLLSALAGGGGVGCVFIFIVPAQYKEVKEL